MNASSPARPVVVGVLDKQPELLDYAYGLARMLGRPLRVVHAFEYPPSTASLGVSQEIVDSFETAAQDVISNAKAYLEAEGAGSDVDYVAVLGSPPAVLDAHSLTAEIVVLGTDDAGWLQRLAGTAVSAYVSLHAHSPVVVVPPGIPGFQLDEVVVTVDRETPAHGPLALAFELADRAGAPLRVVHVVPGMASDAQVDDSRATIAKLVAGWRRDYPGVHVTSALTFGEPVDRSFHVAGITSIVVVGKPHTAHRAITLSRPVAAAILRHAQCPVAVVPPDYALVT